jgi:uncharacterized protein YjhX (UPF0386 family)
MQNLVFKKKKKKKAIPLLICQDYRIGRRSFEI